MIEIGEPKGALMEFLLINPKHLHFDPRDPIAKKTIDEVSRYVPWEIRREINCIYIIHGEIRWKWWGW